MEVIVSNTDGDRRGHERCEVGKKRAGDKELEYFHTFLIH